MIPGARSVLRAAPRPNVKLWGSGDPKWTILLITHRIRMYAIYGSTFTINIPQFCYSIYKPYMDPSWVMRMISDMGVSSSSWRYPQTDGSKNGKSPSQIRMIWG